MKQINVSKKKTEGKKCLLCNGLGMTYCEFRWITWQICISCDGTGLKPTTFVILNLITT